MQFTSLAFLSLLVVSATVVRLANVRVRPALLLVASVVFYGAGGARDLAVLAAVAVVSFYAARAATYWSHSPRVLSLLVLAVLSPLVMVKYLPWIATSVPSEFRSIGDISMPIGVSFYSLQAVGFVVDCYRGRARAPTSMRTHFLFLAFFPQLVAGPIERGAWLLPQLASPRDVSWIDYYLGAKTLLWGFAGKLLVADPVGGVVDALMSAPLNSAAIGVMLALALFSIQIYFDFYAYSCIATGSARLVGIDLSRNFRHPFRAFSLSAFWRRWHMSLSRFLRSFVYRPLARERDAHHLNATAVLVAFLVSGLWHGAGFGYLLWGGLHGLLLTGERLIRRLVSPINSPFYLSLARRGTRVVVFLAVSLLWLPFVVPDGQALWTMVVSLLGLGDTPATWTLAALALPPGAAFVMAVAATALALDGRASAALMRRIPRRRAHIATELALVNVLAVALILFGDLGGRQFIYFRF